jgi:hypothetical protein
MKFIEALSTKPPVGTIEADQRSLPFGTALAGIHLLHGTITQRLKLFWRWTFVFAFLQLPIVAVLADNSEAATQDHQLFLPVAVRALLPKAVHLRVVMILIHEATCRSI